MIVKNVRKADKRVKGKDFRSALPPVSWVTSGESIFPLSLYLYTSRSSGASLTIRVKTLNTPSERFIAYKDDI